LQEKMRKEGMFRIYSLSPEDADGSALTLGSSDSIAWSYFYRKLSLTQFMAAKEHIQYSVFNPVDRLETLPSQLINAELFHTHGTDETLRFVAGLNVRYVLSNGTITGPLVEPDATFPINSPQPLRLYRLSNGLPRAFLIDTDQNSGSSFEFREALSVNDTQGRANPKLLQRSATSKNALEAVRILRYSSRRVDLEATADRKRSLVLLDSFYPGWRATLDGQEVPIVGANYVYRAISFPAGQHHVTFSYEPRSFYYGLSITLTTLAGWILTALAIRLTRRRGETPGTAYV
jgi:hypothetical protein